MTYKVFGGTLSLTQSINYQYLGCYVVVVVIDPMTSSAKLKLNMKPEQSGYIMPKIFLDVDFKEILVELAKSQVCGRIFHPR